MLRFNAQGMFDSHLTQTLTGAFLSSPSSPATAACDSRAQGVLWLRQGPRAACIFGLSTLISSRMIYNLQVTGPVGFGAFLRHMLVSIC